MASAKASRTKIVRRIVAGGPVRCDRCGAEIIRTDPDTQAKNLPVYCRKCRLVVHLDIVPPDPQNRIPDRSLRA